MNNKWYQIWGEGTYAIIGVEGIGKTMTAEMLKSKLSDLGGTTVHLHGKHNSYEEVLDEVVNNLNFKTSDNIAGLEQDFLNALKEAEKGRIHVALIIDDCHLYEEEVIQQIHQFISTVKIVQSNVSLVLLGRNELKEKIKNIVNESNMHILEPLDKENTQNYILFKMSAQSYPKYIIDIFVKHIDIIHSVSGGVPKYIDSICEKIRGIIEQNELKDITTEEIKQYLELD